MGSVQMSGSAATCAISAGRIGCQQRSEQRLPLRRRGGPVIENLLCSSKNN
jgi:hypothetical protein